MTVAPVGTSTAEVFLCTRGVLQGSPAPSCADRQGQGAGAAAHWPLDLDGNARMGIGGEGG